MKNYIKITLTILSLLAVLGTSSIAATGIVNAKNGLVLRESADKNSNPITLIPNETEVNIIEKNGEWYKATYDSKEGFLFAQYVKVSEDVNETTIAKNESNEDSNKIKNTLKVYNIPLITSSVIHEVPENTEIVVKKQITNWSYITAGEIEGWVRTYGISEKIEQPQTQVEETTAEENNVEEIQEENNNTATEEVTEPETTDNTPSNTEQNETTATIKKGFVNVDSANIRKEPTTESEVVTNLIKDTSFNITAETQDWYKLSYTSEDGTVYEGYIFKDLVSI